MTNIIKIYLMFLKKFRIKLFISHIDNPSLLIRTAISGLIAVENDSGLLLALAILNDTAPMAE